jgi:hypothetical protein
VLSYFFLSSADFKDSAKDQKMWHVWWAIVKYLCLQQFVCTAVGVVMTFLSVSVLIDVKVRRKARSGALCVPPAS